MFRARKVSALLGLLLAASLVLTACGPKSTTPAPSDPGKDPAPVAKKGPAVGGELMLRLDKDPDNFNPILSSTTYGYNVHSQVYARLFEFNEKFEPKPYVAKSWTPSDNGLTWTIKIHEGIKFHDGAELTADDVVFTLASIMDPGYKGPRKSSVTTIASVTAADKYTVVIKLKESFAPLFVNINYGILQKKLFEGTDVANFDTHPVTMNPVGAGPYKFVEYKRSQYVLLERNPNWFFATGDWAGAPYIQTIHYKVIPDSDTALAALEAQEIDMTTPEGKDVAALKANYKGKLIPVDYERRGWGYIQFNTQKFPTSEKAVRQALTYAVDRQSVINAAMDGLAVIPGGPLPPVSWAADKSLVASAYDVKKAAQILEADGWKKNSKGIYEKNGQPLKLTFYGSTGSSLIEALASITHKNWSDLGVDIDVQLMDFNAMMDNYVKPGKFEVTFSGFTLGLDPDSLHAIFHSSNGQPNAQGMVNGFNRMRYTNAEVDRLLEDGRREVDVEKRKQIYGQAQRLIVEDAPVILMYANLYTDFHTAKVKGVVNYPGSGAAVEFIYRWYINEN